MPSFILIRPTVRPQYTKANVTDRTDRQTTVRYHRANRCTNGRPKTAWHSSARGIVVDCKERWTSEAARIYLQVCLRLGIVPVSYYLRHVDDERLVLRHHSVDGPAAKAIAASLTVRIIYRLSRVQPRARVEAIVWAAQGHAVIFTKVRPYVGNFYRATLC